jgi:carbonic anhydrase
MGQIQVVDKYGNGPYTYVLANMHVHCHSEHAIDGKDYDLEMHFVH